MNVKLFDKILFFGAAACFLVGVADIVVKTNVLGLEADGWWRGGMALLALATVCLLMQVRDSVGAK